MGNFKGYLLAAFAAAAYGTNPAFAIPLYEMGMNPNSVLLFRYGIGIPILAIVMAVRKIDFKLHGLLIVVATTIVVTSNSVDKFILHVRKMFPRHLIHRR